LPASADLGALALSRAIVSRLTSFGKNVLKLSASPLGAQPEAEVERLREWLGRGRPFGDSVSMTGAARRLGPVCVPAAEPANVTKKTQPLTTTNGIAQPFQTGCGLGSTAAQRLHDVVAYRRRPPLPSTTIIAAARLAKARPGFRHPEGRASAYRAPVHRTQSRPCWLGAAHPRLALVRPL
jgi:hypothetical protein